jgi:TonB-linked SusC/RagA family outer membrane protein
MKIDPLLMQFICIYVKNIKNTSRIMKISIFLLFTCAAQLIAMNSEAQNAIITVASNNITIGELIEEIEQQTDYLVVYSNSEVNLTEVLHVQNVSTKVSDLLKDAFTDNKLNYKFENDYIILSKATIHPTIQQTERRITGKITDSLGEPVIGANVMVKGTTNGTVTDMDGQFSLLNVPERATLQISYIGYLTQEIILSNQTNLNIVLLEDTRTLEEVVVVGYGTLRKKDLTGSVSQVSSGVLETLATTRIEQALTGQISGMQVISKSGMPGESPMIRIRGVGSITAGSEPLYVVDGFPTDNIQTLNPSDIESIDILKDASSTAIYGSRGSNGVIIINTKRGVTGKPTVTADVSYGVSKVYDIPRMMNGPELAEYAYWSVRNRNLDLGVTNEVLDSTAPTQWPRLALPIPQWEVINGDNVVDCDMVREVLRTAPENRYMVGVNGGSENVQYLLSAEYLNQQGVVRNSNFDRLSLRANIDVKLSKKVSMKFNLNPSFTNENMSYESSSDNYGGYMSGSPVNRAQLWPSYFPARDANGEYFMFDHNDASHEWNPLAQVNEVLNNRKRARVLTNLNLDFQLLNELRLNIMLGGTINNSSVTRFEPSLPVFSSGGDYDNDAFGRDESLMGIDWITEYTLHYNKSFGKHAIQGLAGFTAQANWSKSSSLESNRYPNNLIPYLSAVANILSGGTASVNEWSMVSYLARINYNYDSKYYLTASWRADGSSRFGQNNKYGYFPSVSLAWRISQENFLKEAALLSDLKLRVSYGHTGNNNIGGYNHIATINYLRTVLGGGAVEGYAPARLDNPLLTWEVQKQINAGLDVSLFNNRLAITFDYYRSRNTDLLLDVNIPATTGFIRTTKNIGEVENRGFDAQVKTENIRNKDFRWSTDFNISAFRNEVIALGPEGDPIRSTSHITQIGRPIGMFYGYQVDGVFMNQAEVDKGPIFGRGTSNQSRPGDLRFVDLNDDGVINSLDQGEMGNPYPDFTYGMTNTISWKNLSLSVSLYGSYGNEILNLAAVGILNKRGNRVGQLATQLNYWKTEGEPGDGKAPRPNDASTGGNREISQHYMDTGSFLRINNLRLNYDVPVSAIRRLINVNSLQAQLYFNITNLYTFTNNETCFNPDVSNSTASLTPGVSYSDYPLPRTYLLGINIRF